MKKIITLFFVFITINTFSQNIDLNLPKIKDKKPLPIKFTFRTNFNQDKVYDILNSRPDDIPYSNLLTYNVRIRFNLTKDLKIYVGRENINYDFKNTYIGFIKKFPRKRHIQYINLLD